MICAQWSINSWWRTFLNKFVWRQCIACGYFYRSTKRKKKNDKIRVTFGLGCTVCAFREKKNTYYQQLFLDFGNKYRVEGEWKTSLDEKDYPKRIKRTLRWMYKSLGPVVAEDLFFKALHDYWYKCYFTLERNRQS